MYKIAICEDEKLFVNQIIGMLDNLMKKEGFEFKIDTFNSGENFIESNFNNYDIVLLDIMMGDKTGIDVAKDIREENKRTKIIFITAMEEFWRAGFEVNASRYIIKPIKEKEFYDSIISVLKEIGEQRSNIAIKTNEGIRRIRVSEIYYLEINNRKVTVHLKDECVNSTTGMNEWKGMLIGKGFSSPHNSYLVNLKYVSAFEKSRIVLTNGEEVYISKRKYKGFKDDFTNFIGSLM